MLQAFFSVDKSEEIQIKGRTGRWKQKGEYRCIALAQDLLEDFSLELNSLAKTAQMPTAKGMRQELKKVRD